MKLILNTFLLSFLTLFLALNIHAVDRDVSLISPAELKNSLDSHSVELVDVRSTEEFSSKRISGAKNIPMNILDEDQLLNDGRKVVLQCSSGRRSKISALKLAKEAPNIEVYSLDGGIKAWEKAGYNVIKGTKSDVLPIMRQVQIVAGSLIILGVLLTMFVSRSFIILPLFVGCGLLFAGLTGWCGMAMLLAYMPWN